MRERDLTLKAAFVALALIAGCGDSEGPEAATTTTNGGPGGPGGGTTSPAEGGGGAGAGTGGQGGADTGGQGGGGTGGGGASTGEGGSGGGSPTACKAVWSKSFKGDITQQFITDIVPDEKGDILLCGYFEGTVDAGGGVLTSEGDGADMFLVKLDSAGNHVWSKRLGGDLNQYGLMLPDGHGGIILTGQMEGTMDLGLGPLVSEGEADAFIARFDADGKLLWNKRFGGPGHQGAKQARLDPQGNIVFSGGFEEAIDLGGGEIQSAGDYDVYVAKFDMQGNHLWSKGFGDSGQQLGAAMQLDAAGNILLTGFYTGGIDFGGGKLASAGSFDVYVAKLDPQGGHVWSKRFGNSLVQTAGALAVGRQGNVFVTGTFQSDVDFGGGTLTAGGGIMGDLFVLELDAAGNHVTSLGIGGDAQRTPYAIALDADGSPVITGQFSGKLQLSGTTLTSTSPADYDVFVAKIDPAGKHLFSGGFGDPTTQIGTAIAMAAPGQPILGGGFDGTIDFGAGPLVNAPHEAIDYDFFVTRLDCTVTP